MKKLLLLAGFITMMINTFGQSQGISYQAVIISDHPKQIPGYDIEGNFLPNYNLMVRFTILDVAGTIDYQEEQAAKTDAYGMINLTIGQGVQSNVSPHAFNEIDWSGENKDLKVDISLDTAQVFYSDFSYQQLLFVPYAYHKNITATGSMIIDGASTLKSRLDVTNQSPAYFTGNVKVYQSATVDSSLTVNDVSNLNGQVTINANVDGDKEADASYPLIVKGSNQGIVVKLDGSRSADNNFITFRDDQNIQGRIEGQTTTDLLQDPEYIYDNAKFLVEFIIGAVQEGMAISEVVAASTSATGCVGLGACVTAPIPSLIGDAIVGLVLESANFALTIADPIAYNVFKHTQIGISYQSGAGDYAEWLKKEDLNETFTAGDIVGVKAGHISKETKQADHYMVISQLPIVLGNMPEQGNENQYEKVAFMGQVPVKVWGKVQPGDYILPSGNDNGIGIAVAPENMEPEMYQKIVGIAWTGNEANSYSMINVAVGLNANDIARLSIKQEAKIKEQKAQIDDLKSQIDKMNSVLARLVPSYAAQMKLEQNSLNSCDSTGLVEANQPVVKNDAKQAGEATENTNYYYQITDEQIIEGIERAEEILKDKGIDLATNPFFSQINSDPVYKKNFIDKIRNNVNTQMEKNMQRDAKNGTRVVKF